MTDDIHKIGTLEVDIIEAYGKRIPLSRPITVRFFKETTGYSVDCHEIVKCIGVGGTIMEAFHMFNDIFYDRMTCFLPPVRNPRDDDLKNAELFKRLVPDWKEIVESINR